VSSDGSLGGRVGGRMARIVADASVYSRQRMLAPTRGLVAVALEDFFALTGSELRNTMGGLYHSLASHEEMPDEFRKIFGFLAKGHGQLATMIGSTLTGTIIGGGIGNLITNELNGPITTIIASNPRGILAPGDAARAFATHVDTPMDLVYEAKKSGIPERQFDVLAQLNRSYPPLTETLDLLNRGLISPGHARIVMGRNGIPDEFHEFLLDLRHPELQPDRLAQLVTFGVLSEPDATAMAARSGMRSDDFHRLVLGNGMPPSTQELLFAYRRGVINRDRLYKGIQQGPLRNEWFDVVESMGLVPMSVAEAIEAAVKGHLPPDQARAIAQQNGLIPEQFDTLLATAGNPPGIQEMLGWYNRRLMTREQVVQGIRESRLNNKYIDLVVKASEVLPPMTVIRSMYIHGSIDLQRALDLLAQHGYAHDVAAALLDSAQAHHTQKDRELTAAEVVGLYQDQAVTRDVAKQWLVALRYKETDAEWKLDLADMARLKKYRDAVIARVHSAYVKHLMDEIEVNSRLDRVGVPATMKTQLITIWDIERESVSRTLTEAQVMQALKAQWLDEAGALARLVGMGYAPDDGVILINLALKRAPGGTQ
jgi:hypothetical protein